MGAVMAKKQRKPRQVTLAQPSWDMGATGQANRIGLVIEDAGDTDPATGKRINPNGVKRARRVDTLEYYHRQGVISARGYTAGERLRNAWLDTQRSPGWADNDRVQSSPKPDRAVAMQVDRMTRLVWISRRVPPDHAAIIEHVAFHDGTVFGVTVRGVRPYLGRNGEAGKRALRLAFDALADAMERGNARAVYWPRGAEK